MDEKNLLADLAAHFPRERQYLLPALHYVEQKASGLPDFALQAVARHLRVPASEVYGAATSYSVLWPGLGERVLRVCAGLSCKLGGADAVARAARDALPQPAAVEETPCMGMCAVGPVIEVDGRRHGRIDAASAAALCRDTGRQP